MSGKEKQPVQILQESLDLIVLRICGTIGAHNFHGIALRLGPISQESVYLNQGTLYQALVRLEQNGWIAAKWQRTERNRDATYYRLTETGKRAIAKEVERWRRSSGLVEKFLLEDQ